MSDVEPVEAILRDRASISLGSMACVRLDEDTAPRPDLEVVLTIAPNGMSASIDDAPAGWSVDCKGAGSPPSIEATFYREDERLELLVASANAYFA